MRPYLSIYCPALSVLNDMPDIMPTHYRIDAKIAKEYGFEVAAILAAYVEWTTWSARKRWYCAYGRYWTRKGPQNIHRVVPAIPRKDIDKATKLAIKAELIIITQHDDGFNVYSLGDNVIRSLPADTIDFHLPALLEWQENEKQKADQDKIKSRASIMLGNRPMNEIARN